jgi:hypothetical protein
MEPIEHRSEFLSEEDLDLRKLPEQEFYAWWNWWLRQAQDTNDLDAHRYSHGVFGDDPLGRSSPPEVPRASNG